MLPLRPLHFKGKFKLAFPVPGNCKNEYLSYSVGRKNTIDEVLDNSRTFQKKALSRLNY